MLRYMVRFVHGGGSAKSFEVDRSVYLSCPCSVSLFSFFVCAQPLPLYGFSLPNDSKKSVFKR